MKRNSWIILLIVSLLANDSLALNQMFHPDSVLRQDPRSSTMLIEEGEILIRFGDDVLLNITKTNDVYKTGLDAVDEILKNANIIHIAPLFNGAKRKFNKEYIKTFAGQEIEIPNLHHIYRIKTGEQTYELFQLIEQLKLQKEVVYAEPNYIQSLTSIVPAGQVMTADEVEAYFEKDGKHTKQTDAFVPNDPLYGQQWYIPAVKADLVWDSINGKDTTQVIAILDTGVDWLHPDLQNKIWQNAEEIPDNGVDDDGNGKVDDVRGWDWINNDNNPTDDNSHGTHVAGIAAAQQNNSIGISGVSPGAKIMALKVFQSSGRGNTADITEGIIYATQKGATVINMSFGTYARSFTMEAALVNAYSLAVLVAAAGNDNTYIGPELDCSRQAGLPFYPAAFSFVLGVQDNATCRLGFSNYDPDPIQSDYYDLLNYEIKAPGSNILSTIPGGGYRAYQGTSMATPIVAGLSGIYKSLKPLDSQELLWANYIYSSNGYINGFEALHVIPVPKLMFVNRTLVDTLGIGDNDGKVDAGELVEFWFNIRNTWGQCDSVTVMMQMGEFEDTTLVDFIDNNILIGSTSTYSINSNENNTIKLQFKEDVTHNREIRLKALLFYPNSADTITNNFIITVSNGAELSGILLQDTTLTPDRFWMIENSLRIGTGVTLTVLPGTSVEINASVDNRGTAIFNGTADSLINVYGNITGNSFYSHCIIDTKQGGFETNNLISNCIILNAYSHISNYKPFTFPAATNCIFENAYFYYYPFFLVQNQTLNNCIIRNSFISNFSFSYNPSISNSLIDNIEMRSTANYALYNSFESGSVNQTILNKLINISTNNGKTIFLKATESIDSNSFLGSNSRIYFVQSQGGSDYQNFPNNYWGTIDSEKIKTKYYDFWNDATLPFLMVEPKLNIPSEHCHAHVWKVLVNGKDAQDEYVEPVGVGAQRFDVYFNREMDTTFIPQLTFGVRYPYTQQSVTDSARWDSSHRIFTAFKTIQLYTGDGINRIRVAGAREANGWQWDIPVEDMRFEFLIDAAGSASTDFTATPGIGKVDLEWFEPDDLPTLLGYNMYRFHHLTDTTFSDTTMVNSSLVNDTLFTDFNVNPLQKYYYMYKIVRTDFTESDFSKVVNATVLTASPGDANGDQSVNILDITTIVGYILNQNPQPFLLEAADVNDDGSINLLDIIGVVNLVMGGKAPGVKSNPALAYLEPGQILFESDGTLTGFQFQLIGTDVEQLSISPAIAGFEFVKFLEGDTLNCILFSLNNQLIPAGRLKLFNLSSQNQMPDWGILFAGNAQGDYVPVNKSITSLPEDYRYDFKVYPNPGNGLFTIEIESPETATVQILLFDKLGRKVFNTERQSVLKGLTSIPLDLRNSISSEGLHFLIFQYGKQGESGLKYRKVEKLLIIR